MKYFRKDVGRILGIKEVHSRTFNGPPPALASLKRGSKFLLWRRWLAQALRGTSPFDSRFQLHVPKEESDEALLPTFKSGGSNFYLPLEALRIRNMSHQIFRGADLARTFLSSGTTSSDRSISLFSQEGLEFYRLSTLYTFSYVMNQVLDAPLHSTQGLSLIPSPNEWPDSSLAQMVSWISEAFPVKYLSHPQAYADFMDCFDQAQNQGPVWLFATAFHLVDLFDQGLSRKLPRGSVVVETGGTKGKTRSISRDDLYTMIESCLGVPRTKIISEYGMCELACQAYDYVDSEKSQFEGRRYFRFPAWVQVSVMQSAASMVPHGHGCLVIDDPLRVDYPWPIRTEDGVELRAFEGQKQFNLEGRIQRAPLKGCSLLAEGSLKDNNPVTLIENSLFLSPKREARYTKVFRKAHSASDLKLMEDRAGFFLQAFERWLQDSLQAPLATEIGSLRAARAAVLDLLAGIPKNPRQLVEAALCAQAEDSAIDWLVILPRSHSIVGFYPLALGYVLGLSMSVRVPKEIGHEHGVIQQFLRLIGQLPMSLVRVVPSEFRVTSSRSLGITQAILAYGEDDTIRSLKISSSVPVRGFGGRVGIALVSAQDFLREAAGIVKDAFSLGQKGCMAVRLLIVYDSDEILETAQIAQTLITESQNFWGDKLPWEVTAAQDLEAFRLGRHDFKVPDMITSNWPLIPMRIVTSKQMVEIGPDAIAQVPFTLPVLIVRRETQLNFLNNILELMKNLPPLAVCAVSESMSKEWQEQERPELPFLRAIGRANAPVWDGYHEGFPLFSGSVVL